MAEGVNFMCFTTQKKSFKQERNICDDPNHLCVIREEGEEQEGDVFLLWRGMLMFSTFHTRQLRGRKRLRTSNVRAKLSRVQIRR